ncbi:MAG: potassium transporter TrkG [Myxococcota bacterium]
MLSFVRMSGALATLGPLLVLFGLELVPTLRGEGLSVGLLPLLPLLAGGTLVSGGGLVGARAPKLGRGAVALGFLALAAFAVRHALDRPLVALGTGVATILLLHRLFPSSVTPEKDEADVEASAVVRAGIARARGAAGISLAGWPLWWLGAFEPDALTQVLFGVSLFVASGLVLASVQRSLRQPTWARVAIVMTAIATAVFVVVAWQRRDPDQLLLALTVLPLAGVALIRPRYVRRPLLPAVFSFITSAPSRILVATFLMLSLGGMLLLRLPVASATGEPIRLLDAAFTATSAVCVTGLIVLDTPLAFSGVGQGLLLALIQVGGLGIMSFSTVAFAALGQRLSLRHEAAVADLVGDRRTIVASLGRLLGITFGAELLGAAVMFVCFHWIHGEGVSAAAWRAVFTAVSAFCNAGFALQSDSLVPYAASPVVLTTVALLIITGGLSPLAVSELPALVFRRRVSVQTRLVVHVTLALTAVGAVLVGALEWSGTLGSLDRPERVLAAFFQSVTLRTAGFNSVAFDSLRPATVWVMTVFMFVGGSPGGTAGGIKTTTAAILVLAVISAIRGRPQATAYGRHFDHPTVYKAMAITFVSLLMAVGGIAALSVTQPHIALPDAIFESVSALATVGLTTGATGQLDGVGKLLVMVFMFVGRIGPLTLFLFLRGRRSDPHWGLPRAEVAVG